MPDYQPDDYDSEEYIPWDCDRGEVNNDWGDDDE